MWQYTSHEDMIDHHSYTHSLRSCEIKAWKKNSGVNWIRTHDLCDPVQCSTNWAIKPSESWSRCEFVIYHIFEQRIVSSYLSPQFKYIIFHIFESIIQESIYHLASIFSNEIIEMRLQKCMHKFLKTYLHSYSLLVLGYILHEWKSQ